ncbi:HNH endonuclease [uncultured Amnibacterium sp.]|uniref:HNH endonuclease signature motif containing protein n=1 Tax=uncultured Amnibacterium sp. TaxID=1631851 RepID=UPI0035CBCC19
MKPTVVEKRLGLLRDRLDPDGAIERHEQAATRRWVSARPDSDGMAVLEVHSTAIDVAAMYDGIRQAAVDLHGWDGECRTLGQLMADVATDVILHGLAVPAAEVSDPAYPMERIGSLKAPHRKAVKATVLVVVPADTATGANNTPAELAGMGAIDAETARQVVEHTRSWTRVGVDPIDDSILGIDSHDRYLPAGLRKLLHLRTPSCAGDDCGLPAHRADIDHIIRVEHDGRTRHDNLQVLCRKSHQMKDEGYFDVQPLPDGSIRWRDKWGGKRITRPALSVKTRIATELPDDPPF